MKILLSAAAAVAALLVVPPAAAQEAGVVAPADWGAALAEDARAFHDIILDSHPGPVDVENPGFTALLERGLRTALTRAESADSYEHWYFALREFAASFDDGHLSLTNHEPMGHVWASQWPGFLTGLRTTADGEQHQVAFSRDPAGPPPGAVLVSCDGRSAADLARELAGRTAGRWSLASQRTVYAPTVFVDQGNSYVRRPEECLFSIDGEMRAYRLVWRDLPAEVRDEGFAAARGRRFRAPIELRNWDGGVWIGLGGFNGDPQSEDGARLAAVVAEVEAQAGAIREAPAVVFDLRGNTGGSSSWLRALAETLWGEAWVDAHAPRSQGVEWRASAGNLAEVEGHKDTLGRNPEVLAWLEEISDGLTGARAAGRDLWLHADDPRPAAAPAPTAMAARAWVLTDHACASACLDAVDLLKALGAVHVGRETSADTAYMEVGSRTLPSGRAVARIPMKVYRGRVRGNNETWVPVHVWTGEPSDTSGIEAWLAGLDAAAAGR